MNTTPEEVGIWAALGVKLANVIMGAIGSFISLKFFDELSAWQRWTTFAGGWALAVFLSPPLTDWLELKPKMEVGVTLLLGLFGMAIAAAIIRAFKDFKIQDLKDFVRSLRGGK